MRVWIIAGAALLVGIVGGWFWTVAELGLRPSGGERIQWGWPASPLTSPALALPGHEPKLVLENDEFNFGSIELGGKGRHAFVFKNVGRGPLVLTKGETSCVCTLSKIDHPNVAPGGSTIVEVEWHPKSRGPFRQSAQVLTNDPARQRLELTVYGNVVSSYLQAPETIVFSSIAPNRSETAESRVYSFDSDHLAVEDPQWSDKSLAKFFDLALTPLTADQLKEEEGAKSGVLVYVTVKPGLPAGAFAERIRFQLNTPGNPQLQLAIEGHIASQVELQGGPEWDAARGILMLDQVRSREGAKAVLYLMIRGDALKQADFRVAKVVPTTLKATVGKLQKLKADVGRVPLTIEIPPGTPSEDHLGTPIAPLARIFLDTGLPDNKQMQILVRYAIEE
ncbi:MAG TPA: DUF1573 domain-containing protein [Pirellulales bacterium]|nr:DUF1573 domain-containing protein [Pirellulales bacterium]